MKEQPLKPSAPQPRESDKRNLNRELIISLVLLLLGVLVIAGYFAYQYYQSKEWIISTKTRPTLEPTPTSQGIITPITQNLREVFNSFSAYKYYQDIPVVPHKCFGEKDLPNEDKYIEAREHLSGQGRKIILLCTTYASNIMLVQSVDNTVNEVDTHKYPYRVDIYKYFPKDEKDIPSPQVKTVYHNTDNLQHEEIFRFTKWLTGDLPCYSIFDLTTEEFWTYIYNPGSAWDEKSGIYPFYVEYCELVNMKSNICQTVNTANSSNFWTIEKTKEIFNIPPSWPY